MASLETAAFNNTYGDITGLPNTVNDATDLSVVETLDNFRLEMALSALQSLESRK